MKISSFDGSGISHGSINDLVALLPDSLFAGLDELSYEPADELSKKFRIIGTDRADILAVELPGKLIIASPHRESTYHDKMEFIRRFWPFMSRHLSARDERDTEKLHLVLTTHPAEDDVDAWRSALLRKLYAMGYDNARASSLISALSEGLEMEDGELARMAFSIGEWRRRVIREAAKERIRSFLKATAWESYDKARFVHALDNGTEEAHGGMSPQYINELSRLLKDGDAHRMSLLLHLNQPQV